MILDLICQRKVASDKLHRRGNFIKLLQERDRVEFNSTEVKVGRISNWRVSYWKSRWGCYWFTSQIATKSKSDLFWIQESGACSRYPTWSQKYETLGRPLLPSQAFSSELNQQLAFEPIPIQNVGAAAEGSVLLCYMQVLIWDYF